MLNTDGFFTDHPDARTFRIKGATITHKCRPGVVLGMPKPQIKVHLENGTPPYTYTWERLIEQNTSQTSNGVRSEERSEGRACVSTCRTRGTPSNQKKTKTNTETHGTKHTE